jgi:hypothetical protein
MIGGFLSNPGEYSWFPSSWTLFIQYPFALPCVITAIIGVIGNALPFLTFFSFLSTRLPIIANYEVGMLV